MSAVVRSGEAAKDVREPSFPSKASEARPSSRAKRGDPGGVGLALSATPRRPTVEPFVLMVLALVVGLMQSLWYLWHTVYDRVETSAWTPTLLFGWPDYVGSAYDARASPFSDLRCKGPSVRSELPGRGVA